MVFLSEKHRSPKATPLRIWKQCARFPVPWQKLSRLAGLLYKNEGIPKVRGISLVLCSDRAIRSLNAEYRAIDRATDVLSFTIGDEDLLGEIYISTERAKVQARRFGTSFDNEIMRLFVHGFFHLLGYDHKKPGDRIKMEKKECLYL
jgi:probable rRNA maturation factor